MNLELISENVKATMNAQTNQRNRREWVEGKDTEILESLQSKGSISL